MFLVCLCCGGCLFVVLANCLPVLAAQSRGARPARAAHHHASSRPAHAAVKATTGPDLTVNLQADATTYTVGQAITYTITIVNTASAAPVLQADPITVNDIIPAGLGQVTASTQPNTAWSLTTSAVTSPTLVTAFYTGGYPIIAGSSLPPITITGVITQEAASALSNTATVSLPDDSNTENNAETVDVTVLPLTATVPVPTVTATPIVPPPTVVVPTPPPTFPPDLHITQSATGGSLQVGQAATIVLNASNLASAGPVAAGDAVVINDVLPSGFNNLTATGNNWFITLTTQTSPALLVAIYTGDYPIAAGGTLPAITISGILNTTALPSVTNTASVSTNGDTDIFNGQTTATYTILPAATPTVVPIDLGITASESAGSNALVGQPISLTLSVGSLATSGPVEAGNNILVNDIVPLGLSDITVTASGWFVTVTSTTSPALLTAIYTGPYPVLAGGSLPPITVNGILNANAVPIITNIAAVSVNGITDSANNTAAISIAIAPSPPLSTSAITAAPRILAESRITHTRLSSRRE